jgi:hypothetical protein
MAEKKKKSETRIAFEKKFKEERKKQGAGGKFTFRNKEYTTDYASDKKSKKKKEPGVVKKSSPPLKRPKIIKEKLPPGNRTDGDPIIKTRLPKASTEVLKKTKPSQEARERKDVKTVTKTKKPIRVSPKPSLKLGLFKGRLNDPDDPFLINKKKRKEWEKKYGKDYNNDGTLKSTVVKKRRRGYTQ